MLCLGDTCFTFPRTFLFKVAVGRITAHAFLLLWWIGRNGFWVFHQKWRRAWNSDSQRMHVLLIKNRCSSMDFKFDFNSSGNNSVCDDFGSLERDVDFFWKDASGNDGMGVFTNQKNDSLF